MKRVMTLTMVAALIVLSVIGCGKSSKKEETQQQLSSAVEGTSVTLTTHAMETTSGAAAAATTKAASEAAVNSKNVISGVVIDATMNMTTIQSEHGTTLTFATGDDTAAQKVDKSGLKNGLLLGHAIKITCKDAVNEADNASNVVVKMEDAKSKCEDYDALAAAGSVILSTRLKDLNGIAGFCSYPVYVGVGSGANIKDQKEFQTNYKAEDIFTDEFVKAVTSVNLMEIGESDAGMVISANGGKPDVIISKTDDGWNITGINVAGK